jgi:hypothetical protein
MKKFFFLVSSAVVLFACNNDKTAATAKNTDLNQQNLKGKVQTIEESSYAVDSTGKMGAKDSSVTLSDFDEKGYQSKQTTKNSAGMVTDETTITHFDNGATKEVTGTSKGKQTFRFVIDIDSSGKYSGAKSYDSTGSQASYFKGLTQDEFGNVLTGTEYKMDNSVKSSFINSCDKNGHSTGSVGKDSTGKETFHSTSKLNDKGDVIETTTMTVIKDSTKTETTSYKYDSYDDKGNWTQRTTYNDKGKPTKIIKRTVTYYKD